MSPRHVLLVVSIAGVLFIVQAAATFPDVAALLKAGDKPTPAANSCEDAVDILACQGTAGCVWCEKSFVPGAVPEGSCYSKIKAQFLPPWFWKCSLPEAPSTAAVNAAADPAAADTSCKDAVDVATCQDTAGCVWCERDFGPKTGPKLGKCYSEVKAQFLPPAFFKCNKPAAVAAS